MRSSLSNAKRAQRANDLSHDVYDSFSMSSKILNMSATPENGRDRFKYSKGLNNSYLNLRKSYGVARIGNSRDSESTQPLRHSYFAGGTPSKMRNHRMRASSNPKMGHGAEGSGSIRGRRGQLMSASRQGRVVNGKQMKSSYISNQRGRIRKIYNPNREHGSSKPNIMVTDEIPSLKNRKSGLNSSLTSDGRFKGSRYSNSKKRGSNSHTGEWNLSQYQDSGIGSDIHLNHSDAMISNDGRRENVRVEEFAIVNRNNTTAQSLLGNLSGNAKPSIVNTSQDGKSAAMRQVQNYPNGVEVTYLSLQTSSISFRAI